MTPQRPSATPIIEDGSFVAATADVGAGAFVGRNSHLGEKVVVEAMATIHSPTVGPGVVVGDRARIGAGATVSGPITIGRGAIVRPGSVVLDNVPAFATVQGNPAVVVSYAAAEGSRSSEVQLISAPEGSLATKDVCGATLIRLPEFRDARGSLAVLETGAGLPYQPKRVFFTYGVANGHIRGSHAHRELHEVLVALGGAITVVVDDGVERAQVVLDEPSLALHVPPMRWLTQYAYSDEATLAVLASDPYDEADYIRDYDSFTEALRGGS